MAILEVQGQIKEEGKNALYLVRMLKEHGEWCFYVLAVFNLISASK